MSTALRAAVIAAVLTAPLAAQNADPARGSGTKIESLLASSGNVIIKEFYDLGMVPGAGRVLLEGVVFTAAHDSAMRARGLRVEVTGAGRDGATAMAYVDEDEMEAFATALQYLAQEASTWRASEKQEYAEMEYSTRGRLRIGFSQRRRMQRAFVSVGREAAAIAFLDVADLDRLRAFTQRGLSLINSKQP